MQKTITLLKDLKNNFSKSKFDEFTEHIILNEENREPEQHPVFHNKECFELLNSQNDEFYKYLADIFLNEIIEVPALFFGFWRPVFFDYFNNQSIKIFFSKAILISQNDDEKYLIKGIIEIDDKNYEQAIDFLLKSNYPISKYFIAECYLMLQSFKNAIINYNLFKKSFKEEDFDDISCLLAFQNIYLNKGYCYCHLGEYQNSLSNFNKAFKDIDFEAYLLLNFDENIMEGDESPNKDLDYENQNTIDYQNVIIHNYLITLEKTKNYKLGLEVCNLIQKYNPNNQDYKFYLNLFSENPNTKPKAISDDIIPKASNENQFKKDTKAISKEFHLENMIIDHIKKGFKVFGKSFDIYEDPENYGKQLWLNDAGMLDLLLIEQESRQLYVVELKRGEENINVVNQIRRYMDAVKVKLKKDVKGIICVFGAKDDLKKEVEKDNDIEIFRYELHFIKD